LNAVETLILIVSGPLWWRGRERNFRLHRDWRQLHQTAGDPAGFRGWLVYAVGELAITALWVAALLILFRFI
jgi:hypothetical protein